MMPPTGKTLPLRLSSPVMARSGIELFFRDILDGSLPGRIGVFVARERSAVTIVTPALGPS